MCWFTQKPIEMKNFTLAILMVLSIASQAQTIQDFSLKNVADGKTVSLNSFTSCRGIVIIFTSNECPYDNQYRERIKKLNDLYKGNIQFLLINSHPEPRENVKAMVAAYQGWGLPIPYLADKDQVALECLNAKKSPEAFLLKKNGTTNTLVYKGAIDDNPLVNSDVDNAYLKIAIDQLLANKRIEVSGNRAAGCTIRKKQP